MSTPTAFVSDTALLTGRNLRRTARNPDSLIMVISLPFILLLLFVYVFGGVLGGGGPDARSEYLDYVVPGIIVLCAAYGAASTAVAIATDIQGGIVDRLRSLPMAPASLVLAHVVESVVRNLVSSFIVLGGAVVLGARPQASLVGWIAAVTLLTGIIVAISCLGAAIGLLAGSVEAASGFTFFVLFVPYLSSAFVPTESMPAPVRWFAEHQPMTPMIETLRSLLARSPAGSAAAAVLWTVVLAAIGIGISVWAFGRRAR